MNEKSTTDGEKLFQILITRLPNTLAATALFTQRA